MNNASLELGGTNWAEKDASLLGYTVSDDSGRFSPQEFTFARGSNLAATRIGKTGLIEKGRENLLLQSNQFDTTWYNTTSSETGGQSGYDGSNDAWELSISAAAGRLTQSISLGGVQTFSVYAKAGTYNFLNLYAIGNVAHAAYFNLSTGSVGTTFSLIDSSITSVGNGWYKCSITFSDATLNVRFYPAVADNDLTGTTGSIYIQDAQLEQGLVATPYIPTTTTTAQAGVLENTPRLNYTTGVANPYLLLEPSRTNIILYSEGMFDSEFIEINGIAVTGQQTDLNGTNTAVKLSNFVQSSARLDYNTAVAAVDGKTYTYSAYYKGSGDIRINVSTSTGVGGAGEKTITLTDEWVRHSITTTFSSPTGNVKSHLAITRTANNDAEVYMCFVQIEEGTYATSYIPTYSVSQTRAQDLTTADTSGFYTDSSRGTLFTELSFPLAADGNYNGWFFWNGSTNYRIVIQRRGDTGRGQVEVRINGTSQASIISSSVITLEDNHKMLIKWYENEFTFFIDGVNIGSDTSLDSFSGTNLNELTSRPTNAANIKQLLLFPTALSDADCITLTTI